MTIYTQAEEFLTLLAKQKKLSDFTELFDKEQLIEAIPDRFKESTFQAYHCTNNSEDSRRYTEEFFEQQSKESLFCDYLSTEIQEKMILEVAISFGFQSETKDLAQKKQFISL